MWEYNMYGLKPMTTEEAWNAPTVVNDIRRDKIEIGNYCHDMKRMIEDIQLRAREIPEQDNSKHRDLVDHWCGLIKKAYLEMFGAANFGKS